MAASFGVNVTIGAEASRPITIQSNTPIAIVGFEPSLSEGLSFYMSTTKALEAIKPPEKTNEATSDVDNRGSIYRALKAINEQAVETQIVLSVFKYNKDSEITDCRLALEELKYAKSRLGYRPNIIIAPEFSSEDAIKGAIESISTKLKATGITDLEAEDLNLAIEKMNDFGSKRLIACYPNVKVWSEQANDYIFAPQSARVAGLIARVDGESEFGYSDSYSNRVVNGVYGTQVDVDFELGENCGADELRKAHISTIIRESGFRAWGGETSEQDAIWQDLARVRIFDRISEACQSGVLFAIDKKADQLYHAKRSVEELLRKLVGAKVLLGFELSWSDKNTSADITAGKFYLDIRMQNNPIVKLLTLDFIYVDSYGDVLMQSLN